MVIKRVPRTFVAATATAVMATTGTASSVAISAQARHSEPAPIPTATIAGTVYLGIEPPPGVRNDPGYKRPGPLPARDVKITVTRDGEVVARAVTAINGSFRIKARPGQYAVSAFLGPPKSTPGRVCGTANVSLTGAQRAHLRIVCNLR
jgi:hypothetical protein